MEGIEIRGDWTLEKIANAVKNNLEAGLKGNPNFPFSMEQLRDQVLAERNAIIAQLKMQKIFDSEGSLQEINCIELDCEDLKLCSSVDYKKPQLHFKIPNYIHLDYIGLSDQEAPFKVYNNVGSKYNKYRDKRLVSRPYVQLREYSGIVHGFLFNPPTDILKYVSVRAVLENPRAANLYSCCSYNPRMDRFPAPDYIVQQIIDGITNKWASWYYRFQGQQFPNKQNSIA